MKRCGQCHIEKPLTDFLPLRGRGWSTDFCDDCSKSNMAKWSASTPTMRKWDGSLVSSKNKSRETA